MYYRQILKLTAISLIIRPSNFKFNQKFVYFLQYNNYCLLSPKVFLIHLSLYIAKIGLYNNSWKHQIYKQIKKGEKERKQRRKERLIVIVIPSIRIPMRRDSVPVVGYLSFLASNSPIANAFIALLDHLLHSQFTHYNFST